MKKTIALSLVFAILSAATAFIYFSSLETSYKSKADPINVIIAKERIPQGAPISPSQISQITVPKEYAQPKVFNEPPQLFNENSKALYASLAVIEKGEQILSTKVSKLGESGGIGNIIPDGHKALTVNFESAADGVIVPGSRIDIMAIMQYTDKNKQVQEAVFTAVQNALVLAVGGDFLGAPKKKDSDAPAQNKKDVTLAVTIEQAQTIMLASQGGTLRYIVRPPSDNETASVQNMKMSDIVKDGAAVKSPATAQGLADKNTQEILDLINKYQ
jgi:pilus assembly protein CpaB